MSLQSVAVEQAALAFRAASSTLFSALEASEQLRQPSFVGTVFAAQPASEPASDPASVPALPPPPSEPAPPSVPAPPPAPDAPELPLLPPLPELPPLEPELPPLPELPPVDPPDPELAPLPALPPVALPPVPPPSSSEPQAGVRSALSAKVRPRKGRAESRMRGAYAERARFQAVREIGPDGAAPRLYLGMRGHTPVDSVRPRKSRGRGTRA